MPVRPTRGDIAVQGPARHARASLIAAGFVAASDLVLGAVGYWQAAAGGGLFAQQAPFGALGLAVAALAAVLVALGLPSLGILLSIGGLALAGGFFLWDVVPQLCGPAALGAVAVVALFFRELARGTKHGKTVTIPSAPNDPMLGLAVGLTCALIALASAATLVSF